jgi:hypothetical protein
MPNLAYGHRGEIVKWWLCKRRSGAERLTVAEVHEKLF